MDLLVVDYAMPGMNGLAVIDRALARHEGLKALLISGHAEILHAGVASGVPLLVKPFNLIPAVGAEELRLTGCQFDFCVQGQAACKRRGGSSWRPLRYLTRA